MSIVTVSSPSVGHVISSKPLCFQIFKACCQMRCACTVTLFKHAMRYCMQITCGDAGITLHFPLAAVGVWLNRLPSSIPLCPSITHTHTHAHTHTHTCSATVHLPEVLHDQVFHGLRTTGHRATHLTAETERGVLQRGGDTGKAYSD